MKTILYVEKLPYRPTSEHKYMVRCRSYGMMGHFPVTHQLLFSRKGDAIKYAKDVAKHNHYSDVAVFMIDGFEIRKFMEIWDDFSRNLKS